MKPAAERPVRARRGGAALAELSAAASSCLAVLGGGGRCEIRVPGRSFLLAQRAGELYLSGELALRLALDGPAFWRLCGLAAPGIAHPAAALCPSADGKRLKFVRWLAQRDSAFLLRAIEQMMNQMDVWQALLAEQAGLAEEGR